MGQVLSAELLQQFNSKAKELNILPIKVTPHYKKLVQEEYEALGQKNGPLYRAVYPSEERLNIQVSHEVPDFVEDKTNMPDGLSNVLIHKYHQRALFLVTDKCSGHCMYCFRQDVLTDIYGNPLPPLEDRIERTIQYLNQHPEITEIILSGGDPLNIPFRNLSYLFEQLKQQTSITDIRIHTRNLVFAPQIVTDQVIELLGTYHARIYLHVIHPYEIEEKMTDVVRRLQDAGVRTYSQFPILRGINDHVQVLEKLMRKLDELRTNPINVFIPDPINYSATFRIPMKRLLGLMDELYWSTGSWTNAVRLVLDSPIGKVRREDIASWNEESGEIVFKRQGKDVIYHDFPADLDHPGELDTLLWKG
ncbi:MAG: 4Fe-4S cluster-binding domain-containing protein [Candidatus Electrothrix sp. AW3_4]|nr:4Fe-4S cluster-binding domain-containing protein [Candidatus Electrothrix gigas]